jgi:hypothetical protein
MFTEIDSSVKYMCVTAQRFAQVSVKLGRLVRLIGHIWPIITFAAAKVLLFSEICKFFFAFLGKKPFARTLAHTFKVRTAFAVQRYNKFLK